MWQRRMLFTSWQPGSKKRQRKDLGQDIVPKDMHPVTNFLQLGLTSKSFHHFSIMP
jgi:hypothetical protein